jgi:hypothetical protein
LIVAGCQLIEESKCGLLRLREALTHFTSVRMKESWRLR